MEKEELLEKLKEMKINHELVEHDAIHTIDDMKKLGEDYFKNSEICKNLFLRDQKGKRHFLVLLCANKQADLEKLRVQLKSTKLSFGSAERLMKRLGLEQGYVSPMGLINDKDALVEVAIDRDLKNKELIAVHPNTNLASILLTFEDLEKFITNTNHKITYINI